MQQQKHFYQLLPIIIIGGYFIKAVWGSITTIYSIPITSIVGYGIAALMALLYFFNERLYRYLLALTLIVGVFNFISFSLKVTRIDMQIQFLKFPIQPLSLLLLAVLLMVNKNRVKALLERILEWTRERELTEEELAIKRKEGIEFYKRNLQNSSREKLNQIINDENRIPESREAAKLLLNDLDATSKVKGTD